LKDVEFLEVAEQELDEAIEFYNQEKPGVGDEFLIEVLKTLDRIREFPQSAEPFTENTRRALTRRFSYGIIYENTNTLKLWRLPTFTVIQKNGKRD
jgi:hypothetical protein